MDSQLAWLSFCIGGRNKCVAVGIRKMVCATYIHAQSDVPPTHMQNDVSSTIRVREVDKTKVPVVNDIRIPRGSSVYCLMWG